MPEEEILSSKRIDSEQVVATLASYLDPEGGLRVPSLVVVDEQNHPRMLAKASEGIAEMLVALPAPRGEGSLVRLFAHDGDPGDPDAEPTFGIELVAGGNCVYQLSVLGTRGKSRWEMIEWSESRTETAPTPRPGS